MQNVSETDRAYTAGILDGEGSISLAVHTTRKTASGRPSTGPKVLLQVSSTDRGLIDWLCKTWGAGHVATTYRPKKSHHKIAYGWRVWGASAAEILQATLPYLKIKAPQARLAIEYRALVRPCRKLGDAEMAARLVYRERMMAMNGRNKRPAAWVAAR